MRVCIRSVLLFELWEIKFAIIKSYSIINRRNRKKLSINISVSVRVRGVEEAKPFSPLFWLLLLLSTGWVFYLWSHTYSILLPLCKIA